MPDDLNRRSFLRKSIVGPAAAAVTLSLEEKALLAQATRRAGSDAPRGSGGDLPTGQIRNVKITRLIVGGNLTSGFAHSRDLIYVSSLLRGYFTTEKIFETWQLCEECGIDTAILRLDDFVIEHINRYWNERGGQIKWIAQIKPREDNVKHFKTDIKKAIDNGAVGAYVQGGVGDRLVQNDRVDLIGSVLEYIKQNGVIAGVGAHAGEVPIACEKAGLEPDFYMKTLHSHDYWSANRQPENDNIWSRTPQRTIDFMQKVNKPWIAFKVMAAGAIHPREGFKFAYENGADFICAGMFDFQVREDAVIARDILSGKMSRKRPWRS